MDFLRDPLWQFLGVIATILTFIVSIVYSQTQRARKSLTYNVLTARSLIDETWLLRWRKARKDFPESDWTDWLSVEDYLRRIALIEAKDSLENRVLTRVLSNQGEGFFQKIETAYFLTLKLSNNGNTSILTHEYEDPLVFHFGKGTRLPFAEIIDANPESLLEVVAIEQLTNCVRFKPVLLNPGDWVLLKVLLTDFNGSIITSGRIVGVKDIVEQRRFKIGIDSVTFLAAFVSIALLIAGSCILQLSLRNYFSEIFLLVTLSLTIPVVEFLVFLFFLSRFKKI